MSKRSRRNSNSNTQPSDNKGTQTMTEEQTKAEEQSNEEITTDAQAPQENARGATSSVVQVDEAPYQEEVGDKKEESPEEAEETVTAVGEKELPPTNFPFLAGRVGTKNLITKENRIMYVDECFTAFRILRSARLKNKEETIKKMSDFCEKIKERIDSGFLTRDNYTTDFQTVVHADTRQFSLFMGTIFELIKEPALLNDVKKNGSMDKYFRSYNIPANKDLVVKIMTEVLAG